MPNVLKSGNLNLLEPSGPLQACNGITLPLLTILLTFFASVEVETGTGQQSPEAVTFLNKGKSIIAGQSCFKPAQGVLTCSGVNVAVLRNERVSMRGEQADAPRDGIVVGSHHQYQQQLEPRVRSRYCSRARAHGTTNPNQYHIFATLPTSAQFPLPFLALGSLPTHTTPQHQITLRKQQSSLIPHTEEAGNDYNSC